jgi:hypothetical protein
MMGVRSLPVSVPSRSNQAVPKLEIALVLDISGSMGRDSTSAPGTTLAQLQVAAKQFIDTVLNPDTEAQTLVSIVPFSQQVNLQSGLVAHYKMTRHHTYANCLEYRDLDFDSATMPLQPGTAYRQSQHFIDGGNSKNRLYQCPKNNNAVTAYSNNAAALKNAIDALTVETWTATYMGMKWGTALLDPGSRPIVSAKVTNGELPSEFAGWPLAWNDPSVRKITVVMSPIRARGVPRLHLVPPDEAVTSSGAPRHPQSARDRRRARVRRRSATTALGDVNLEGRRARKEGGRMTERPR